MNKFSVGDTVRSILPFCRGRHGVIEQALISPIDSENRYCIKFSSLTTAWFTENELELVSTAPRKDDMHSYNKVPFSLAISWLQKGIKMRRKVWQDDIFVKEVKFNGFAPTLVTYYGKDGEDQKQPGCILDWDDIVANDWVIVE